MTMVKTNQPLENLNAALEVSGDKMVMNTRDINNLLAGYQTNNWDDASDPCYIGKAKTDAEWAVLQIYDSGIRKVAMPSGNPTYTTYATAYAARVDLSYLYFYELV